MDKTSSPGCCCGSGGQAGPTRRGFCGAALAVLVGAAGLAAPLFAGLLSVFNPLRQKSAAGQALRLTTLDSLPEDGTPRKFPVLTDRSDGWTRFRNEPVGAVFLRRLGDKVSAIHVVCPHAGCFVTYNAGENIFFCPCHVGRFDLSGKRLDEKSPSPRDLDTLEAEVRNGNEVWVKFENYQTGTPNKVVQA